MIVKIMIIDLKIPASFWIKNTYIYTLTVEIPLHLSLNLEKSS